MQFDGLMWDEDGDSYEHSTLNTKQMMCINLELTWKEWLHEKGQQSGNKQRHEEGIFLESRGRCSGSSFTWPIERHEQ